MNLTELKRLKRLRNQRGFIATATLIATAGVIAAAGTATAGIVSAVKGSEAAKKGGGAPMPVNAPAAPNSKTSLDQAQDEANKRRIAAQTTGGQTNLTGGSGYVDAANVQKKNLLGS